MLFLFRYLRVIGEVRAAPARMVLHPPGLLLRCFRRIRLWLMRLFGHVLGPILG